MVKIITIVDNKNCGNRLQNYAVQYFINEQFKIDCETIKNISLLNKKTNFVEYIMRIIKFYLIGLKELISPIESRKKYFDEFNKNIIFSEKVFNFFIVGRYDEEDIYIVGSDQVWNPNIGKLREFELATFTNSKKKISFSASIGAEFLENEDKEKIKNELRKYKAISVREEAGKRIIDSLLKEKNTEVLVDPTMLLTADEWDKVAKRPEQLQCDKYILTYFLGELSDSRKKEIQRIAKENNCEVINLLDKSSEFYATGPSEFLYLEKNAFLICTDSFHSSVFAILYDRPFIVFNREGNGQGMNSRIETLLSKFKLKNREYNGKNITNENLHHDYTEAYKILENEREKSKNFLKKALDIKD